MTTREQIIAAAKEAGIKLVPFVVDGNEYDFCDVEMDTSETLERFYAIAHEAGAASRDAEIAELQRNLANEQARDIHSCHHNCAREGCVNRRLRAELAEIRGVLALSQDLIPYLEALNSDTQGQKENLLKAIKRTLSPTQTAYEPQINLEGYREAGSSFAGDDGGSRAWSEG